MIVYCIHFFMAKLFFCLTNYWAFLKRNNFVFNVYLDQQKIKACKYQILFKQITFNLYLCPYKKKRKKNCSKVKRARNIARVNIFLGYFILSCFIFCFSFEFSFLPSSSSSSCSDYPDQLSIKRHKYLY